MNNRILLNVVGGISLLAFLSGCSLSDSSEQWDPETIRQQLSKAGVACSALTLEDRTVVQGAFSFECIEPGSASIIVFPAKETMDNFLKTNSSLTSVVGANWVIRVSNSAKAEAIVAELGGRILEP